MDCGLALPNIETYHKTFTQFKKRCGNITDILTGQKRNSKNGPISIEIWYMDVGISNQIKDGLFNK